MTVGTPSVRTGATQDVMLSVVRAPSEENPTLGLRIMVQPMVLWLWIGGLVMVIGTALSLFPGRRRNPLDPVSAPAPIEVADPDGDTGATAPDAGAPIADALDEDASDEDAPGRDDGDPLDVDESVGADR